MIRPSAYIRVSSMLLAALTSTLVIGATVVGMQPDVGAGDVLLAVSELVRALAVA